MIDQKRPFQEILRRARIESECIVCSGSGSVDPTARVDFASGIVRADPGADLVSCPVCNGTGVDENPKVTPRDRRKGR